MKLVKVVFISLLVLIAISAFVGCSTLGYYSQSIQGHMSLMNQRQPINELLTDEVLDQATRQRLKVAVEVRDFASSHLGLPDNGSYRSYVDLDREYVVWNVVAAPEFSMQPKEWCFPVAGCVSYRGYYQLSDAETFGTQLKAAGYDVALAPAPAYSTLGWFDDPVVSTMFRRGELILAENIFHELAHQQLYIQDDSLFNEAFASSVGEEGVYRWLTATNREDDLVIYQQHLQRKSEFINLLRKAADQLKMAYQQNASEDEMRQKKQQIFKQLKMDYAGIREQWGGYSGYDRWFDRTLNNAHLVSVAVYRDRVPDFNRWLTACNDELTLFYRAIEQVSQLKKQKRHEKLMGPASCEGLR